MRSFKRQPALLRQKAASVEAAPQPAAEDSEYPPFCVPITGPPPKGFSFPRDHGNHPEQAVEWWWYLGNFWVASDDPTASPRHFGAELCFLRKSASCAPLEVSFMLASLAVADDQRNKLMTFERGGFLHDTATVHATPFHVSVGNWRVKQTDDENHLRMVVDAPPETSVEPSEDHVALDLRLVIVKPIAKTGPDGYDGNIHLAQPRITAEGSLTINGETHSVRGIFWVERQWLTSPSGGEDPQWNWFAFQFDDGTELTLGIVHPIPTDPEVLAKQALGCYLDADGNATYVTMDDLEWQRSHPWTSPRTGIHYPGIEHDIVIPSLDIRLHAAPFIEDNEVVSQLSADEGQPPEALYYEGASRVSGTRGGVPIQGVGYTELVGFEVGRPILP